VPERLVHADLASGRLDEARASALVAAYEQRAPLTPADTAPCRRCCAPRRCASGSRACGTGTCRATQPAAAQGSAHFERVLRERIAIALARSTAVEAQAWH
jgi:hypothetical protein